MSDKPHYQRRGRRSLLVVGLLAVAGITPVGCGEDQGPDVETITLDDLLGEWTATSALYTTVAGREFDLLAAGGSVEITVPPGGLAKNRITLGDSVDEWDALWVVADAGVLRSFPVEWERPVRTRLFRLIGNELTLIDGDATFDFTLSGAPGERAREEFVLVRR